MAAVLAAATASAASFSQAGIALPRASIEQGADVERRPCRRRMDYQPSRRFRCAKGRCSHGLWGLCGARRLPGAKKHSLKSMPSLMSAFSCISSPLRTLSRTTKAVFGLSVMYGIAPRLVRSASTTTQPQLRTPPYIHFGC